MENTKKLIEAARSAFPDSHTVKALCDALAIALNNQELNLTIKQNMQDRNRSLTARVKELETICAESYQVVGALANAAGVFETSEAVSAALDNLSQAKLVHTDVLPFVLPEPDKATSPNQQLLEQMIADLQKLANPQNPVIPPMSSEMFRQQAALAAMNGLMTDGNRDLGAIASDAVIVADALVQELAK